MMQFGCAWSQVQNASNDSVAAVCSMPSSDAVLALRRLEEMQLPLAPLVARRDRLAPREAGVAEAVPTPSDEGVHPPRAEIGERVRPQVIADLRDRVRRGDQLLTSRRIDAIEARMRRGGRADAHVHLPRAGLAN